jgi:signal transduction histidine kinase
MMPKMNGHQTLEAIRALPGLANTPFIFLTARTDRTDVREGMALGADDYLTKPFKTAELIEAINSRLQRKAAQKADSQQEVKAQRDRLMRVVPHELRTPLNGILGVSQLLDRALAETEIPGVPDYLRMLRESGRKLDRQIQKYTLCSRISILRESPEALERCFPKDEVETALVFEHAAKALAQDWDRTPDLTLHLSAAKTLGETDHLLRLATELISNAFDFSEPGMPVEIISQVSEGKLRIQVLDRGQGADWSTRTGLSLEKIASESDSHQGLGLGLSCVQALCEVYGYDFAIASREGGGTEVTLTLPHHASEETAENAAEVAGGIAS